MAPVGWAMAGVCRALAVGVGVGDGVDTGAAEVAVGEAVATVVGLAHAAHKIAIRISDLAMGHEGSIARMQEPAHAQGTPGYEIRRSTRARRSRLTITEKGQAVVVLPLRARDSVAADLVARHRDWIDRHVARIRSRQAALAGRPPLEAGRPVSIAGTPHRVVVTTTLRGHRSEVRQEPGLLVVQRAAGERRSTAQLLEAWLRARARDAVAETLGRRAVEMGLEVHRLAIRDQRTRWGSASRRGTLSFNWRLAMCPPEILDYVVVHELAHLRHAGHGPRFWALVRRHFADTAGARRWLRDNHEALRHALD